MLPSIADLRREYALARLDERDAAPDPIVMFSNWFAEALAAEVDEPNAMTLATASPDGVPSARIVLLKDVDPAGFVFFTDHRSRKADELEANPRAALVFHWRELERQVRVAGAVARVSREATETYFRSRPLGSRLGAWASEQSSVIESRAALEARLRELEARFADGEVPAPPHWGGYRVAPGSIEFWQGRASRLHDRIRYTKRGDAWTIERLSP
jgi:pyridoxamine 5'-phosphate oxidase